MSTRYIISIFLTFKIIAVQGQNHCYCWLNKKLASLLSKSIFDKSIKNVKYILKTILLVD